MKFTRTNNKKVFTKNSKIYSNNNSIMRTKINKKIHKSKKRGGASREETSRPGYLVKYSASFGNFYYFSFDIFVTKSISNFKLDIICNHNMPYAQEMVYDEFLEYCKINKIMQGGDLIESLDHLNKYLKTKPDLAKLLLICSMIPKTTGDIASFMSLSYPVCARFKIPIIKKQYSFVEKPKNITEDASTTYYMCPIGLSYDATDNETLFHPRVNGWCSLDLGHEQLLGTMESLLPIVIMNEFYTIDKFMKFTNFSDRKHSWLIKYKHIFDCLQVIETLLINPNNQEQITKYIGLYNQSKTEWPWKIDYKLNEEDFTESIITFLYKDKKLPFIIKNENVSYKYFREFALNYVKLFTNVISEDTYKDYEKWRNSDNNDELLSNCLNNNINIPSDIFRAGGILWRFMDPNNMVNKILCFHIHKYNSWSGHDIKSARGGTCQNILTNSIKPFKDNAETTSFTWTRPGLTGSIVRLKEETYISITMKTSIMMRIETMAPDNCGTSRQIYRGCPIDRIKVNGIEYSRSRFNIIKWDDDTEFFYKNLHGTVNEIPLGAVGETGDPGGSSIIAKKRYILGPLSHNLSLPLCKTSDDVALFRINNYSETKVEGVEVKGAEVEMTEESLSTKRKITDVKSSNLKFKMTNGVIVVVTPLFKINDCDKYCEWIQRLKEDYINNEDCKLLYISEKSKIFGGILPIRPRSERFHGDYRCFEYCESESKINCIRYIDNLDIISLDGDEDTFKSSLKKLLSLLEEKDPEFFIQFLEKAEQATPAISKRGRRERFTASLPPKRKQFYLNPFIEQKIKDNYAIIKNELLKPKLFIESHRQKQRPAYKRFLSAIGLDTHEITEEILTKSIELALLKLREPEEAIKPYTVEEIKVLKKMLSDQIKECEANRQKFIRKYVISCIATENDSNRNELKPRRTTKEIFDNVVETIYDTIDEQYKELREKFVDLNSLSNLPKLSLNEFKLFIKFLHLEFSIKEEEEYIIRLKRISESSCSRRIKHISVNNSLKFDENSNMEEGIGGRFVTPGIYSPASSGILAAPGRGLSSAASSGLSAAQDRGRVFNPGIYAGRLLSAAASRGRAFLNPGFIFGSSGGTSRLPIPESGGSTGQLPISRSHFPIMSSAFTGRLPFSSGRP